VADAICQLVLESLVCGRRPGEHSIRSEETGVHLITMTTMQLPPRLLAAIRELCDEAFDKFTDDDWAHAQGGWHVVLVDGDLPRAHAAIVPRTIMVGGRPYHTGYGEAVATAPAYQGRNLGARVMAEATAIVRRDFEFGALATGSHGFYEKLGWERWRGPTFARDGEATRRTPDDDDAVMVLRFGPSAGVDLGAELTCERRAGDQW
jgi:aminoglycoside 2'-N-acetyltransferase I